MVITRKTVRLPDFSEILDADVTLSQQWKKIFTNFHYNELVMLEMLQEFFLICDEGRRCKFIYDENVFPHIWWKMLLLEENLTNLWRKHKDQGKFLSCFPVYDEELNLKRVKFLFIPPYIRRIFGLGGFLWIFSQLLWDFFYPNVCS
jgi:hypothetical protein